MPLAVTVVVKDKQRQYEALRSSLGLLLEQHRVTMLVLDHEIDVSEEYMDNMDFIDEMGGRRLSNRMENVEKHGFVNITLPEASDFLRTQDLVIPF